MIKVIATDMDGTFLRDDKTFDEERFKRILSVLEKEAIKFVIASGNQYRQLRLNFPAYDGQFAYVAENGAHIISQGQTLFEHFIDRRTVLAHFAMSLGSREAVDALTKPSGCWRL